MLTDATDAGILNNSSNNAIISLYNKFDYNGTNGMSATPAGWTGVATYGVQTTQPGSAFADYQSSTDYRLLTTSTAAGAALPPLASIGAFQLSATSVGEIDSAYVK